MHRAVPRVFKQNSVVREDFIRIQQEHTRYVLWPHTARIDEEGLLCQKMLVDMNLDV
jgi:hypothetical protein